MYAQTCQIFIKQCERQVCLQQSSEMWQITLKPDVFITVWVDIICTRTIFIDNVNLFMAEGNHTAVRVSVFVCIQRVLVCVRFSKTNQRISETVVIFLSSCLHDCCTIIMKYLI